MKNSFIFLLFTLISNLYLLNSSIITLQTTHLSQNQLSQIQNYNGLKTQLNQQFDDFRKNFAKIYVSDVQFQQKINAFRQNMIKLQQKTCSPCGVTSLMDKNIDQINALKGLLPGRANLTKNSQRSTNKRLLQTLGSTPAVNPPLNFDWRKYNVVTVVKSQKDCGVCWAFTVTAFYESELIRRKQANIVIDLAEQFLYQCDNASYGCQGGFLNSAMQVALFTGIPRQMFYPYRHHQNYSTAMCSSQGSNPRLDGPSNVVGFVSRTTRLTDDQIIQLLLQRPLMLGVYADDWFYYKPTQADNIMKCSLPLFRSYANVINHAVLLVGYTDSYWIIKNSWGSKFGINGFIYVSRDPRYNCGVGYYLYTLDYELPVPKF